MPILICSCSGMAIRTPDPATSSKSSTALSQLAEPSLQGHALHLRDRGFVVLDDENYRLDASLVDGASKAVLDELDDLLALVSRFGCDPDEQNYNFQEICHRYRQRWDMRVRGGDAFATLTDAAVQATLPVSSMRHFRRVQCICGQSHCLSASGHPRA